MYIVTHFSTFFSQWVDGSVTDFVWWDEGYPPVNHRDCLAAFPGLGWRDVHCHPVGSSQGVGVVGAVVCQIDLTPRTINISNYNSTSDIDHKYIPVIVIIITAFAVTLIISIIFTLKFLNKINIIFYGEQATKN